MIAWVMIKGVDESKTVSVVPRWAPWKLWAEERLSEKAC